MLEPINKNEFIGIKVESKENLKYIDFETLRIKSVNMKEFEGVINIRTLHGKEYKLFVEADKVILSEVAQC